MTKPDVREEEGPRIVPVDDLASILMQLPLAVGVFDAGGRLMFANARMRAYVSAWSPSRDPERRDRWRAFAAEGEVVAVADWPDAQALGGRAVENIDFLHTLDDGREVWLRVSANPFRDERGALVGAIVAIEDVDAHRRAERHLRDTEERFSRFMQHVPGLAWIKDMAGHYVFANDAALHAFGSTAETLYGRTDEELFPSETARQFRENDLRAVSADAGLQTVETLAHGGDDLHFSLVSKFPIRGASGDVALIGGIAIDITERIRAEQELKEAHRRKDEFLATLAHELRNPLAPLRNGIELMKLARSDADAVEETRLMMERQLRQMVRLIDDLLDLSRISQGRVALRKERVQLLAVVQQAVETSRPALAEAGHELTISMPPDPIHVEADTTRLAQVLSNLLNNAAKFTERGGHVRLTIQRRGAEAMVSVRDNGIGIPPDMLPKVFDMFTQVDRTVERGGLGIGLSLVKRLVEMHGGAVEARSDGSGLGAEFIVRLPVLSAPEPPPSQAGAEGAPRARGRRILVVDDNRDAALSLAIVLRITGNETQVAHDGLKAVELAESFRPDVILLDIGMPGMNGYDTARRIRAQPWGRDLVIVALTGWGQEDDRRRSREAGFNAHLVKPAEPAAIEKLLATL